MPSEYFRVEYDPEYRVQFPYIGLHPPVFFGQSHEPSWEHLDLCENTTNNIRIGDIVKISTIEHGIQYALVWEIRKRTLKQYALVVWYASINSRVDDELWTHFITRQATIIPLHLINDCLSDELRHEFCNNLCLNSDDLGYKGKWMKGLEEFYDDYRFDPEMVHYTDRSYVYFNRNNIPLINAEELVPNKIDLAFPQFRNLPKEVRMMIWDLGIEARTCTVYPRWYERNGTKFVWIQLHIPDPPKALFTCRESYEIFRSKYKALPASKFGVSGDASNVDVFIDFRRDNIFLHEPIHLHVGERDLKDPNSIVNFFVKPFKVIQPDCRIHNLVLGQRYYHESNIWETLRYDEFFCDLETLGFVKNYPASWNIFDEEYGPDCEIIPCVLGEGTVMSVSCETGNCRYQSRGPGLDIPHLYYCFKSMKKEAPPNQPCQKIYEALVFGSHPKLESIRSVILRNLKVEEVQQGYVTDFITW